MLKRVPQVRSAPLLLNDKDCALASCRPVESIPSSTRRALDALLPYVYTLRRKTLFLKAQQALAHTQVHDCFAYLLNQSQGDTVAKSCLLGHCYATGSVLASSMVNACASYEAAAKKGCLTSMVYLCDLYLQESAQGFRTAPHLDLYLETLQHRYSELPLFFQRFLPKLQQRRLNHLDSAIDRCIHVLFASRLRFLGARERRCISREITCVGSDAFFRHLATKIAAGDHQAFCLGLYCSLFDIEYASREESIAHILDNCLQYANTASRALDVGLILWAADALHLALDIFRNGASAYRSLNCALYAIQLLAVIPHALPHDVLLADAYKCVADAKLAGQLTTQCWKSLPPSAKFSIKRLIHDETSANT